MALTPIILDINTEEIAEEEVKAAEIAPSKTFNLGGKRLTSQVDGTDAVKQFIDKTIRTTRNNYLIYDGDYGSYIDYLISQSLPLSVLEIELPRLIEEALISDDRIESVGNFTLTQERDGLHVEFTVELPTGEFIDSEVIL